MAVIVIAQPKAEFDRWLAHNAQPAAASDSAGARAFNDEACADCHQIRGTDAHGTVGPDLTHVASRLTLAAGKIPNDRQHLRAWLRHPQRIKPGNKMPDLQLPDGEWRALETYLESLR
jgi:cytochrome c oxidase subunit 2